MTNHDDSTQDAKRRAEAGETTRTPQEPKNADYRYTGSQEWQGNESPKGREGVNTSKTQPRDTAMRIPARPDQDADGGEGRKRGGQRG